VLQVGFGPSRAGRHLDCCRRSSHRLAAHADALTFAGSFPQNSSTPPQMGEQFQDRYLRDGTPLFFRNIRRSIVRVVRSVALDPIQVA
jgi:hypothetical protein